MKAWLRYENFWFRNILVFFLFSFLTIADFSTPTILKYEVTLFETIFFNVLLYTLSLFNNLIAIQKWLLKRKFKYYGAYLVIIFTIITIIDYHFTGSKLPDYHYPSAMLSAFSNILSISALYFGHLWIMQNLVNTKKELMSKELELNFLKQQLSPHFLFNALNNLYGYALTSPQNVDEKILELSDLLRYQIEAIKKDQVCVLEEIEFIDDYLENALSRNHLLTVNKVITGEQKNFCIPPLLFLPFVENAVKYVSEIENPCININWQFTEDGVVFQLSNNCLSTGSKVIGTKTGLVNVKRRLELLLPDHTLIIQTPIKNNYTVDLKLWNLNTES
jgi:two-component system, LytTR family, sensor kinase